METGHPSLHLRDSESANWLMSGTFMGQDSFLPSPSGAFHSFETVPGSTNQTKIQYASY